MYKILAFKYQQLLMGICAVSPDMYIEVTYSALNSIGPDTGLLVSCDSLAVSLRISKDKPDATDPRNETIPGEHAR